MQQVVFVIAVALGAVAFIAAVALSVVLIGAEGRRRWLRRADRPTGRLVDVNGTPIHVIERGPRRGPTVDLVAGVGGVGAHWAGIIDRLSASVHTIAYDRAGLGWSGSARAPRTLDARRRCVVRLADRTGQNLARISTIVLRDARKSTGRTPPAPSGPG